MGHTEGIFFQNSNFKISKIIFNSLLREEICHGGILLRSVCMCVNQCDLSHQFLLQKQVTPDYDFIVRY